MWKINANSEAYGYLLAYGLMIGIVGLYDDFSTMTVSSSASAHLSHLLEGSLIGTEVGEINQIIGTHDAHHAHVVEVEPFCDHLCAHEYVDATVLEIVDNLKIAVLLKGAVQIHSCHTGVGEENGEIVLNTFCAKTFHSEMLRMTGGTFGGDGNGIAAVVASHTVGGFVVDERDITMLAGGAPMAVITFDAEGETSPVLEKDDLLVIVEGLPYVVEQELREVYVLGF